MTPKIYNITHLDRKLKKYDIYFRLLVLIWNLESTEESISMKKTGTKDTELHGTIDNDWLCSENLEGSRIDTESVKKIKSAP